MGKSDGRCRTRTASFAGSAAGFDLSSMYWNPAAVTVREGVNTESHAALILGQSELTATGGSLNYTTFDAQFNHNGLVLLRFTDTSTNNGASFDTYIDAVSITAIPTPAALPAGLTLLAMVATRRRRH